MHERSPGSSADRNMDFLDFVRSFIEEIKVPAIWNSFKQLR